ncbi:hypothetical protein [Crocosphaera sp. Alani8]|uniref:hypothetical protein n=1 Tax=Crocosphaera sp. Alani8 TaxID=3038952 RepID=UPI00313D03C4
MLERFLLASTVTWLLYVSLQLGQSPMTPKAVDKTANRVTVEQVETHFNASSFGDFRVAQK